MTVAGTDHAPARVLVVEHEALICDLIEQALREAGCAVVATCEERDAYELLSRQAFQTLVVDIDRPFRPAGAPLALHGRRLHRELRVVYITGSAEPRLAEHGLHDAQLVGKPFSIEHLTRTVVRAPQPRPA